jgi:MFS family permease
VGSESTAIAYPLVVLALTQSVAQAGLVSFARVLPFALFGLLAGITADRFDRKRVMMAADGMRALAVGSLAVAIALDQLAFWQIPLVAFVEGAGTAFFLPAAAGALRSVVATNQLEERGQGLPKRARANVAHEMLATDARAQGRLRARVLRRDADVQQLNGSVACRGPSTPAIAPGDIHQA